MIYYIQQFSLIYTFRFSQQRTMLTVQCNLASRLSRRFVGDSSLHPASCTPYVVVVARHHDSLFEVPSTISADPASGCRQALTVRLRGDPPNCMKTFRVKVRILLPPCRALLLLPRLGNVVSVPSLCMCGASVYDTHHKFVHLFFQLCTSIRPYVLSSSLLPRSAILGTLKQPRPYSSSSSNRRHAHSDAVVEPRSMSLTLHVSLKSS